MSACILIGCDGTWDAGFPCRGAFPSRSLSLAAAREQAARQGWSGGSGHDLCPAHTLRAREGHPSA